MAILFQYRVHTYRVKLFQHQLYKIRAQTDYILFEECGWLATATRVLLQGGEANRISGIYSVLRWANTAASA